MLELASSGSKFLCTAAWSTQPLQHPIHVRSSFSGLPGTWVSTEPPGGVSGRGEDSMEQALISVCARRLRGRGDDLGVPDKPGQAAAIFRTIANAEINIDMVVQNVSAASTGLTDISFTLPKTDGKKAIEALRKQQGSIGYDSLRYDDQIAKISSSARHEDEPGVTATFFEACPTPASTSN